MKKILLFLLSAILFGSCKVKKNLNDYNLGNVTQTNVRFGSKYFSIYTGADGKGFVVKGKGTNYRSSFQAFSADTSQAFFIKNIDSFRRLITKMGARPFKGQQNITDAPRVEIYDHGVLIYDAFSWNDNIFDLLSIYSPQLPKGFNPFKGKENPF